MANKRFFGQRRSHHLFPGSENQPRRWETCPKLSKSRSSLTSTLRAKALNPSLHNQRKSHILCGPIILTRSFTSTRLILPRSIFPNSRPLWILEMVVDATAQGHLARRRTQKPENPTYLSPEDNVPKNLGAIQAIADILPQSLAVIAMLSLIFGGCCSNVRMTPQYPP